ncbi:hypothetical protein BBJ28_00008712 [Nothophytophthora sp. Chile5]|nr:hypothetical protein BBJ28_00008712 [Nothophytophthora sp. Chile5]
MEAQARALEDEVRQVCELEQSKQTALQKQRLYSRVGQFLMGSLDMRHWWCGYPSLMVFMMRVLELYPGSESVCPLTGLCTSPSVSDSVDIYHASLPSVLVELEYEYTAESIKAFFFKIAQLDAERIQRELATTATGLASDSRVTAATTSLALYEVLSERRLLSDFRIVRVLSKVDALCFAYAMMSLSNQDKLEFYFQTRGELLRFLICEDRRPAHFEAILAVALSRAAFSILEDCYEHRLPSSASKARSTAPSRDDGALSESISIDYSVSDSAFWWPCGSGANNSTNADLEEMWMDHLFNVVVMPKNVESLVDHAAKTSAVILSKHLQLARDVVFTCLATPASEATGSIEAITKSKPIVTRLLSKLCSWKDAVTIPLSVHGALFESIGGISELLNGIATQLENNQELQRFTAILREYEAQLLRYLTQMCDEVFLHDLTNPFYFPVVSQHLSACYLSPTSDVDLKVKRYVSPFLVPHLCHLDDLPAHWVAGC